MDERLEKALEFSNFMVTLNNQKRLLQEQFKQDIIFYFNGGQFTVTKELLSFCDLMLNKNQIDLVLIDDNDMPIMIEDLKVFTDDIFDIYFNASNKFLTEYSSLKSKRSIQSIVEV